MTADRDDLDAVLAKHQEKPRVARGVEACICGESVMGQPGWHRAHVAQMVLESDWPRGVQAEAFKEGWIDSAIHHATCDECGTGILRHDIRNPYRADRVDAEDGWPQNP